MSTTPPNIPFPSTPPAPIQQPAKKPFYKSKGFWGSALSAASLFVPAPLKPIVTIAGSALGLYGRTVATQPLTFGESQQQ